jgi:hypothetical protein
VGPTRGTKREAIRVEPDLWRDYGEACNSLGTNRSKHIRSHMERTVRSWRRARKRAAREAPQPE